MCIAKNTQIQIPSILKSLMTPILRHVLLSVFIFSREVLTLQFL